MTEFLPYLVWWLAKAYYRLIILLKWIIVWCHCQVTENFLITGTKNDNDKKLSRELIKLKKLPTHLGVIFLTKDLVHPLTRLNTIVNWCILAKLRYLTIYLPNLPKELNQPNFEPTLFQLPKGGSSSTINCQFDPNKLVLDYIDDNEKLVLSVRLRDSTSYNEELIRAARNLRDSQTQPSSTGESTYKDTCRDLRLGPFPEPNLIIAPSSPQLQLYGFPPLQLRSAEFYPNPFPHRLYYRIFYTALKSYSRTQQRNGK